jgi:hypothetical protein
MSRTGGGNWLYVSAYSLMIRGSLLQLIQVMRPPSVFFTRELIFNQSGDGGTHHNMEAKGYKCVQKVCKQRIFTT